jgi:hypothetical protein
MSSQGISTGADRRRGRKIGRLNSSSRALHASVMKEGPGHPQFGLGPSKRETFDGEGPGDHDTAGAVSAAAIKKGSLPTFSISTSSRSGPLIITGFCNDINAGVDSKR